MPCYQQVTIEASIRLSDRSALSEVLQALGAVLDGQIIRRGQILYRLDDDGSVSANVADYERDEAETFLKELKREYAMASLGRWALAQKFQVRRQGNKLKARRWV